MNNYWVRGGTQQRPKIQQFVKAPLLFHSSLPFLLVGWPSGWFCQCGVGVGVIGSKQSSYRNFYFCMSYLNSFSLTSVAAVCMSTELYLVKTFTMFTLSHTSSWPPFFPF